MLRVLLCSLFALVATSDLAAQVLLVPSDRAPYRQKFDLQLPDAQYLFLPQSPGSLGEGPYQFRFRHPALNNLLEHPSTVRYAMPRDGGVYVQILHLRSGPIPDSALGRQEFEIINAAGEVSGTGALLVLARLPEAVELVPQGDARVLEVGRAAPVQLRIRTHGNFRGEVRVVNRRDWELADVRYEPGDSGEVLDLRASLRALRADAGELRLALETVDGRTAELAFPPVPLRAPAPRRVRISGGPVYLDRLGRGAASVRIAGVPASLLSAAEIVSDPASDLIVSDARPDTASGELRAQVEFIPRTARAGGTRELREIVVRSGVQSFRGYLEVVGSPTVTGARTDRGGTAATLPIGGTPVLLRVAGQNLDGLRLDCAPLGSAASCRNVSSTPTELVEEVRLGTEVREGEALLPLAASEARAAGAPPEGVGVRVLVERPSLPAPLATSGMIRLGCERPRACRPDESGESIVVRADEALQLRLLLNDAEVGAEHGWQKLVVGVTRVRGEQRQAVRSIGTPAAPRLLRQGGGGGALALLDASADPRHGDVFIVRVEHVAEQYPAEYRSTATGEAWVRRIYVDGGLARRITGDIAVQPLLFSVSGSTAAPLYPNAGFGVTWQFLNPRLEPRLFSAKLQLLATDIKNLGGAERSSRPALFLSGNLRIPGTDPARPLVLTTGIAHMLSGEDRWRLLAGAGVDLGVARMIFGG